MNETQAPPSAVKRLALTAVMRTANIITGVFQNITIISIVGFAACAVGYVLFFQWLSYQEWMHYSDLLPYYELLSYQELLPYQEYRSYYELQTYQGFLNFRRHLPALLSVIGFMYAIYKIVPVLEDFWGLKRTRINTNHPLCMYAAITMWVIFINSIIFAFGYQIENGAAFHVMLENFFGRYGNDTPHYIAIARDWYQDTLCDHRLVIVFFPLYSILIRIMYFISPSYMFAAYIISNIFAIASGVIFYKLAALVTNEKEARLAVKFLFIFPSALFLFVPLTESLFLFLSIAVIYYTIKSKYIAVFVFGLLATLTRSVGMLLIIPVAYEAISQLITTYRANAHDNTPAEIAWHGLTRKDFAKFACLLAFPLGMGIYLLINFMVYGSATQFMVFQADHWGQNMYYFWHTITYLTSDVFTSYINWVIGVSLPGVIAFWLTLALIIYGANKIRPSLTLYALAYFIFAFGPTWLMSGPRYAMVLFPLAFVAAKFAGTKKGYNLVLTIAYLVMFVLYFHEFIRDNFVF